jgi:peptidase C39-like protein
MKGRTKPKGFGMAATVLLAALLIAAAFVPASAAESPNSVSIDDAKTVASFYVQYIPTFIANYSEWQEATVEQSTVYHNLDGKRSAYAFNVIENGQYAGYILVSATRDNYPILEFSTGRRPNAITELTTRSETMAQKRADENGLTAGEAKPLYLGATFYYAEYPLIDDRDEVVDRVVVDLTVPVIIDLDASQVEMPIDEKDLLEQQQMKREEANALWDALEEKMTTTSLEGPASSRGLGYIYDVPNYLWQCGCSPTASGMVLGYWDSHGYPNFPGETTLIEELAVAMGTEWPGNGLTWPWDIDDGIEEVCENHGYSNFDASNDYWMTWNEVKDEVDASKPFVISMSYGGTGSGHSKPYGKHSITCVGYSDSNEDYVFIHDTWDEDGHHYIAYGNWLAAMATWVRP